jgi:hypothetical protein
MTPKELYEFDPGRVVRCAVCKVQVETDIAPRNACSEHKAQVAKLNKAKVARMKGGRDV